MGLSVTELLANIEARTLVFWLLATSLVLLLLVVTSLPPALSWLRSVRQARRDYKSARGTQHRRLLEHSLKALSAKIGGLERAKRGIEQEQAQLAGQLQTQLRRALTDQLVQNNLVEASGIGPILSQRIVHLCYDGTLRSLLKARNVYGIGDDRYASVYVWVRRYEEAFPRLLELDFAGKQGIVLSFAQRDRDLSERSGALERELEPLRELEGTASAEQKRLAAVSARHFVRARGEDATAMETATSYLKGSFAEWESVPDWFKRLISEYGG